MSGREKSPTFLGYLWCWHIHTQTWRPGFDRVCSEPSWPTMPITCRHPAQGRTLTGPRDHLYQMHSNSNEERKMARHLLRKRERKKVRKGKEARGSELSNVLMTSAKQRTVLWGAFRTGFFGHLVNVSPGIPYSEQMVMIAHNSVVISKSGNRGSGGKAHPGNG